MSRAHDLVSTAKPPAVFNERELELKDLDRLIAESRPQTQRLKAIREVHHRIARMMAAGLTNVEVAASLGLSVNRMSLLRGDPAFQELLAFYTEQEKEIWQEVREHAAQLGITAAQVIHERMLDDPEKMKTADLLSVMRSGLDYGGHKPAERSESLHVHTTAEQLARIKAARGEENVSVRGREEAAEEEDGSRDGVRGSGGSGGEDAIEGEIVERTEGRDAIREAGAESSEQDRPTDEESVD